MIKKILHSVPMDLIERAVYVCIFFSLIPSVNLGHTYSHVLIKLGMLSVVGLFFLKKLVRTEPIAINHTGMMLVLIFFLSQTLSSLHALNAGIFLDRYKDIAIILLFFVTLVELKSILKTPFVEHIVQIVLLASVVNLTLVAGLQFFPELFIQTFSPFLHPAYIETIQLNLGRGKTFFQSYDEIAIPISFYLLQNPQRLPTVFKPLSWLVLIMTPIISFLSDVRTRIVMLGFAIVSMLAQIKQKKIIAGYILAIGIVLNGVNLIQIQTQGYSVVDRFTLRYERDYRAIATRVSLFKYGLDIGSIYPVFGIGLGQYDYYAPWTGKDVSLNFANDALKNQIADDRLPHDVFTTTLVESGIVGVLSFTALVIYWLLTDIRILKKKNAALDAALIGAFWTLFIHSLFNPVTNYNYLFLFWTLRGLRL